jgi:hypothetical protein
LGRDSVVGIATRYWSDGPGIKSQWRQVFPHLSRFALGPTQSPVQWIKRPEHGVDHALPPQSSTQVKEGVELYL